MLRTGFCGPGAAWNISFEETMIPINEFGGVYEVAV